MISFKDYYRSLYPAKEGLELIGLLVEGGAVGHMLHVYDDRTLKFSELKQMLSDVFKGEVEILPKADGQNISVTYKDGKIGLARNKSTIKNPMSVEETASKFAGRGEIQKAFVNSMKAIERAFKKISAKQLDEWFGNGKRFMSAEIIYPPTKNVIDYGNRCMIMIHNLTEFDDEGNKVSEDPQAGKEIYEALKNANATNQDSFEITGPQAMSIKDTAAAAKELKNVSKQIDAFVNAKGLNLSSTIQDYIDSEWVKIINKQFGRDLPEEVESLLLKRFAYNDTSASKRLINKTVKDLGLDVSDFAAKFDQLENNKQEIHADIMDPLEMIIAKSGAAFIKCLSGFISVNPDETVNKLKKETQDVLDSLNNSDDVPEKLVKLISKLNKIGLENIAPEEGIVFKHSGKLWKLTGIFGKLNQVLGFFRYGGS